MFKKRFFGLIAAISFLNACGYWTNTGGKINHQPAPSGYANGSNKISLLNPNTRDMIHCYNSAFNSAENCARTYEQKNFVRYQDIPYKTANYDFLTKETYPTRRWREYERTPRW